VWWPPPPAGNPLSEGKPDAPEQLPAAPSPDAVVRRWFERIDRGGVPDINQYLTPDWHSYNLPPFPGISEGIRGAWQAFPYALKAFTDFQHEIEGQVVEGDKVATRMTAHGKHTGEFLGVPATGKDVT